MIQPDMELSDSEDEGEGGRRNHQENKTAEKPSGGQVRDIDISSSTLLSGNPTSASPQTTTSTVPPESIPNSAANDVPASTEPAQEPEKNDSVPMDVDSTAAPSK
jgi:histone deacetylase 1/2